MTPLKKLTLLSFDFFAVNAALSLFLYFFRDLEDFSIMEKKTFFSLVNLLWLLVSFYSHRLYGRFQYTAFNRELRNLLTDIAWFSVFFTCVYVFIFDHSTQYLFSFLALNFGALILCRFAIKLLAPGFSAEQKLNYITVGYSPALPGIEKTIHEVYYGRIQHIGSFGKKDDPLENYIGEVKEIFDFMREHHIDLVLYSSSAMSPTLVKQLMRFAKQNFINFSLIPVELEVLDESGAKLELHNGFPLLSAKDEKITHLKSQLLKRIFDITFSSLVIIFLLSWLMPLIALLIMLESKGSPIFVQNRIGHRGQRFRCYKFRSMSVQENGNSVVQAKKNDARITKIGAFIRRTNIDELPQFINVFKGDMSVVGPRPHAESHDEEFANKVENYIIRHYAKPGISGWAQVNGFRGPTDTDEKISLRTKYDLWYLKHWSFLLDLKIIYMTLFDPKAKENGF